MPERIDKLTEKQSQELPAIRDEWLNHGLSTMPAARVQAVEGVNDAYRAAGLKPPPLVIWLRSPLEGVVSIEFVRALLKSIGEDKQVWDQVSDQVRGQVSEQVWNQVRGQVSEQVWNQVWGQVWNQVRGQVSEQVRDQVWNQVSEQVSVGNQVWDQVSDQVSEQVWNQVWDQVSDQVSEQVSEQVSDQVSDQVWGQVSEQVWNQVWNQVGNQVWDQVSEQVSEQVWNQVRDQVSEQVSEQVWDQVRDQVGSQVSEQVRDQVSEQVRGQVSEQVSEQVSDQVRNQVWDQVWNQAREEVRDQVSEQVSEQVRDQVGSQVGDQVWNQVSEQVSEQVRDQVWNQVRGQVSEQVVSNLNAAIWGQHEAGFMSWLDAFRGFGLKCCAPIGGLIKVAQCAGWWWPMRGVVIITERPSQLHRDDEGRLHNETGPAVLYPDGWGVWAIHGVRVTQQIVECPEELTVEQIREEQNQEVRRVMMDRFGAARYLRESNARLLDEDKCGKLWLVEVENDEPLVMVEVLNSTPELDGTAKTYWLRVPPGIQTAKAGIAWTFDVSEELYEPLVQT
jgi:hypothetical protein